MQLTNLIVNCQLTIVNLLYYEQTIHHQNRWQRIRR